MDDSVNTTESEQLKALSDDETIVDKYKESDGEMDNNDGGEEINVTVSKVENDKVVFSVDVDEEESQKGTSSETEDSIENQDADGDNAILQAVEVAAGETHQANDQEEIKSDNDSSGVLNKPPLPHRTLGAQQIDLMFFHFTCTLTTIKVELSRSSMMQDEIARKKFNSLSERQLYREVKDAHIPFIEWPSWIKTRYTTMYVQALSESDMKRKKASEIERLGGNSPPVSGMQRLFSFFRRGSAT